MTVGVFFDCFVQDSKLVIEYEQCPSSNDKTLRELFLLFADEALDLD